MRTMKIAKRNILINSRRFFQKRKPKPARIPPQTPPPRGAHHFTEKQLQYIQELLNKTDKVLGEVKLTKYEEYAYRLSFSLQGVIPSREREARTAEFDGLMNRLQASSSNHFRNFRKNSR